MEQTVVTTQIPPQPSKRCIKRQEAIVEDDPPLKPIIRKQLSFPDELPHYHHHHKERGPRRPMTSREKSSRRDDGHPKIIFTSVDGTTTTTATAMETKKSGMRKEKSIDGGLVVAEKKSKQKPPRSGRAQSRKSFPSSLLNDEKPMKMKRCASAADLSLSKMVVNGHAKQRSKLLSKHSSLPETNVISPIRQPSMAPPNTIHVAIKSRLLSAKPYRLSPTEIHRKLSVPQSPTPATLPNRLLPKPPLPRQNSLPNSRCNESRVINLHKQSSVSVEELLSSLQVKPANKLHSKLRFQRNDRDSSTYRSASRRSDVLAFPEVPTMVSEVSPIPSDAETNEHQHLCAIPVAGPMLYSQRANYGRVLRPAFLGRPSNMDSENHSRASSAESQTPSSSSSKVTITVDETRENPTEPTTESTIEDQQIPPTFNIEIPQQPNKFLEPITNQTPTTEPIELEASQLGTEFIHESRSPSPSPNQHTKDVIAANEPIPLTKLPNEQTLPKHETQSGNPRLAQEKECLSLHQNLSHKGVNISLQTLQRALMTPTEFRMVHHARRAQSCLLGTRIIR